MAASTPRVMPGHAALIGIELMILAFVLHAAFQPTSAPLLPHGNLRVGVDPSYPPFAFYEGQQPRGFEIDLAELLADSINVPIQLVALGFDGLYDAIKADRVDLVIAALSPDPLRTADVRYSRPYFDNGLLLVSRPEARIESMHNLSGFALAYAFGSAADAEARRWLRRIHPFTTLPYETPTIALDAVRIGTAQSALVESVDLAVYAAAHPEWQPASAFVTHAPFVVAVGADRGALAQVIDRLLRDMEADGRLESLRHRWF